MYLTDVRHTGDFECIKITNPPAVHVPKPAPVAKPFPWKWVYIGGGAVVLIAVAVLKVLRKNRNTDFRCLSVRREV
jgi:hypothetical protein